MTVAFGSRDRILLASRSRHLGELPPATRVATLPGCGHVPMADDPAAVAALVIAGAASRAGDACSASRAGDARAARRAGDADRPATG